MSEPKLNIKEETSAKKTRSPPKKAKVEQSVPKKKKLKTDADKDCGKSTASAVWQGGTDPGRTEPVEQGAEAGDVRRPCRPVCGAPGS